MKPPRCKRFDFPEKKKSKGRLHAEGSKEKARAVSGLGLEKVLLWRFRSPFLEGGFEAALLMACCLFLKQVAHSNVVAVRAPVAFEDLLEVLWGSWIEVFRGWHKARPASIRPRYRSRQRFGKDATLAASSCE